jgi:DNA-binding MarR family transcriptional regulator
MTNRERQALSAVANFSPDGADTGTIAEHLNWSTPFTYRYLRRVEALNLVVRTADGSGRAVRWAALA